MSDEALQGSALVLMLAALPLISAGAWNEIPALWWAGLAVLALGALIPPVTRYAGPGSDDDENERDMT